MASYEVVELPSGEAVVYRHELGQRQHVRTLKDLAEAEWWLSGPWCRWRERHELLVSLTFRELELLADHLGYAGVNRDRLSLYRWLVAQPW